jgi:hypothetical protein
MRLMGQFQEAILDAQGVLGLAIFLNMNMLKEGSVLGAEGQDLKGNFNEPYLNFTK